jgi:hypothetical protein
MQLPPVPVLEHAHADGNAPLVHRAESMPAPRDSARSGYIEQSTALSFPAISPAILSVMN